MSGVRQHYLPLFLLKGFASKVQRKEVYTWVFTGINFPFQANIKKIGIEKEFYGDPAISNLDDKITSIESKLSNYINSLRGINKDRKLDSAKASKLIYHIFVRAKNIRSAMINVLDFIFRIIIENLPDSESLQKSLFNYFKKNPELILDKIEDKSGAIIKYHRNLILDGLMPIIFKKHKEEILLLLSQSLKTTREKMPNLISESHLKALSKKIIPEKRTSPIENFKWSLVVREPGSFILGDVGPIARIRKSDSYCSLIVGVKEINLILFPISHSHLIIGSEHNFKEEIDIDFINHSISACSIEYFISSFNAGREKMYLSSLSKKSTVLPENELEKLAGGFLAELIGIT